MRGPIISAVVSGLMLAGVALSERRGKDEAAIESYHESIARAVDYFPVDFGIWVGHEVPIPPSATRLLRPNALVAREYITDARGGVSATLMLVQCEDIRDMQGHYPPNCYPAHGWAEGPIEMGAAFGDLEMVRYEFHRSAGNQDRGITVYNLFVMPTGEVTTSMDRVRRASADYLMRPYGAAQVQIVIGDEVDPADHPWVLEQMHAIAEPVMDVLLTGAPAYASGGTR